MATQIKNFKVKKDVKIDNYYTLKVGQVVEISICDDWEYPTIIIHNGEFDVKVNKKDWDTYFEEVSNEYARWFRNE